MRNEAPKNGSWKRWVILTPLLLYTRAMQQKRRETWVTKKGLEKARVIYLLLCPVEVLSVWFVITHLSDPMNEIFLFLITFLYIAGILFIEAKAGIQAFRTTHE
jgi:hypothetical protein